MELFDKHKEQLLKIAVEAKTDAMIQMCKYLKEQEPEISDKELIDCVEAAAKTGITEA